MVLLCVFLLCCPGTLPSALFHRTSAFTPTAIIRDSVALVVAMSWGRDRGSPAALPLARCAGLLSVRTKRVLSSAHPPGTSTVACAGVLRRRRQRFCSTEEKQR